MEDELLKYRTAYTADSTEPFWACAVKGCKIPFPHEVGMKEDRKWQHVWADFYYSPAPGAPESGRS
jgi:hypothetical protein